MIPTAEEIIDKIPKAQVDFVKVTKKDLIKAFKKYAKLHTKAALEAAGDKAIYDRAYLGVVTKESILEAYPENLIK